MILSYKDSNVHFGEKSQSSMEGEEFGHIDANAIGSVPREGLQRSTWPGPGSSS